MINIDLPSIENDKKVKDVIISILSFDWPLSLAKINAKAHKEYQISKSYQATFKALNELVADKIVTKNAEGYALDISWAKKLKAFSENIIKNYESSEKGPVLEGLVNITQEDNLKKLTFDCLANADRAWLKIKEDYYSSLKEKNQVSIWEGNHCWWLLVYPKDEYQVMNKGKDKSAKSYKVVHNDSPLDQYAKKFYEDGGTKFKISKDKIGGDMSVFGDTIMQITLPAELKNAIDEVYKKCKNPSEVNISDFIKNVIEKKINVELTLTKNKEIAQLLKSRVIQEFK